MICTLLSNSAYATIAPFLPIELDRHDVPELWFGPIFAAYSVAVILVSPLRARLSSSSHNSISIDHATVIACGMAGMGICLACFGLIMWSRQTEFIIVSAIVVRFFQGASSALIQTSCYVIATNDYPNNKEQIVGIVEATTGIGLLLGSVIGSILYAATNFETTFFVLGATVLTTALLVRCYFPHHPTTAVIAPSPESEIYPNTYSTDLIIDDTLSSPSHDDTGMVEDMSYVSLLKSIRFTLALLNGTLCYWMFCFLEPILSQRLLDDFNLSVPQIALFFSLFSIFYIPTSICVQFIPPWIDRRITISASLFASSITFFLVGPSQILHFPNDSLLMIGIGWSILGVTLAMYLIPILPEMVAASKSQLRSPEQAEKANMLCSGLFNSFLGIGQIIGPLYGSAFFNWFGFRLTTDIAAVLGISFCIIYVIFSNVRDAFRISLLNR